jgi:hypothetical protein
MHGIGDVKFKTQTFVEKSLAIELLTVMME